MFYTMTLRGRLWKYTEADTEDTGILLNIVWNSMEGRGNIWKLLVLYSTWAQLAPTLTHVITRDPVTSGAEDEQCHHSSSRNDGLPQLKRRPAACMLA